MQAAQAGAGSDARWEMRACRAEAAAPLSESDMAVVLQAFQQYGAALAELQDTAPSPAAETSGALHPSGTDTFSSGSLTLGKERLQRAYEGYASTDTAGIIHALQYEDLEGGNIPVPGGYQNLANQLAAEAAAAGVAIHCRSPITKITWDRDDGRVGLLLASQASETVLAHDSSPLDEPNLVAQVDVEYSFDAVIVTVSLGVLKSQGLSGLFEPPLPPGPRASGSTADELAAPLTAADLPAAALTSGDNGRGSDAADPAPGTHDKVGRPLVCFAGEATSRHFMGTVHGAFLSGEREAERLLQYWRGS
eukprot:gene13153-13283_t